MARVFGWLLGILLSGMAGLAGAAELVIADDAPLDRLHMAQYISYYTGNQQLADIHAASQLPDTAFVPVGAKQPLQLMQTRWFRFSVHNATARPRSLVLDFDQALYSRIAWLSRSGTVTKEIITGQNYPFDSRDIHSNYFAFRLDIAPGETVTTDFSLYTPYAASFVPVLSDQEKFMEYLPQVWQFSGSVVGMLYAVFLFLLIYIARMPALGAVHAMLGQVFFSILSVLYLGGMVQRWLPDSAPLRDIIYIVIHGGQGVCYSLAVRSFFRAPLYFPWINRILLALVVATVGLFILVPLVALDSLLVATLSINFLMMLFSVVLAIISLVRRQQGTTLFAIGLNLFVVMVIISLLGSAGILPASFMTRYSYELGLTLQADFMFLAIATRIFTMEREKMSLQAEMLQMDAEMKARSEFVDRISHDVKSPLTAVLGAEQLLRNVEEKSERDRYLDMIRTSCGMMLGIVDDMLTHSRIKGGQLVLQEAQFSLRELLEDIESSFRVIHQDSHLAFFVSLDPDIPLLVRGDRLRVSQVLGNLLGNAFKFTDEGRVELRAELIDRKPGQVLVRFVVQDTGIGLSEDFVTRAFESYARDEAHAGYRPGFGLGLAICRYLVERMGGTIDVLSAVGKGSRFTAVIPFAVRD